jgi:DNA invertase Pin-like site-specific DNA recombinase
MKVAIYIRVSRIDLHPENQLAELKVYAMRMGYDYTVLEELESTRKTRPVKQNCLQDALNGKYDKILVYKLDRWCRSLQELINDFNLLRQRKIEFESLKDNIILNDDPRNMLMIHMIGAFAEFEREMIRERTLTGLARARAEGRIGGRPRKKKPLNKTPPVKVGGLIGDLVGAGGLMKSCV